LNWPADAIAPGKHVAVALPGPPGAVDERFVLRRAFLKIAARMEELKSRVRIVLPSVSIQITLHRKGEPH